MKTMFKISLALFFFVAIVSCTKEAMKPATSQQTTSQSTATSSVLATHSIGEKFGGGIIFYLDSTLQHGLIAAPSDLTVSGNTQIKWYNGAYIKTGATDASLGAGKKNTNKIVSVQGSGTYAAKLCYDLVLNGYSDWYLPSKKELNQLYKHKANVPGLQATNYWSSTEYNANTAWDQEFASGYKFTDDKRFTVRVRAVRSF